MGESHSKENTILVISLKLSFCKQKHAMSNQHASHLQSVGYVKPPLHKFVYEQPRAVRNQLKGHLYQTSSSNVSLIWLGLSLEQFII